MDLSLAERQLNTFLDRAAAKSGEARAGQFAANEEEARQRDREARRRKQARPLYLELRALGLDLVGRHEGGAWRLDVRGLKSLSPAHADRVRARAQEHERGLLWTLYGGWDGDIDAIQRELR
ncbi:MAG: hypothetical protein M3N18_02150 [Actinomycetota bacterium]|nr:hypothetical protein [Actinomycetota bacterium]